MQVHHVSRILLHATKPCLEGLNVFFRRQGLIEESVQAVCGIGLTLTEDAPSILISQCVFIGKLAFKHQWLPATDIWISWVIHTGFRAEGLRLRNAGFVLETMSLAFGLPFN